MEFSQLQVSNIMELWSSYNYRSVTSWSNIMELSQLQVSNIME